MASAAYTPRGRDAASLQHDLEEAVLHGRLAPGDQLPSVRALARDLGLSPSTVASAYRELRRRGLLVTQDRARTLVAHQPVPVFRLAPTVPEGTVDLATGNPDPTLLPDLAPVLAGVPTTQHRYTEDVVVPALREQAVATLRADGIPTDDLVVVGGALDGIERVLGVHLRPGDRIGVEDPGYPGSLDLVRALGLEPIGIEVDADGLLPDHLEVALADGLHALLLTPRGQNPTGAALTPARTEQLRRCLAPHPEVLAIEDDHLGAVAGAGPATVTTDRPRWAVIRSVAKWLGPQLRVAVLAADADTAARVLARQRLGTGWVSQLLQHVVAASWSQAEAGGLLERATERYTQRRTALLDALAAQDVAAIGASGLNVWIPTPEEATVVQALAARGWAVAAGEVFRLRSAPAIRITTATLDPDAAPALARDVAEVLADRLVGRRG
ncbi:MAG: aminotransferase class I/II-fold pyridoxal phosphate-dependent enzyme [Nitriliruptoraceae bacterium]